MRAQGISLSTHLIGIAGPSCSGKSELAHRLARILKAPIVSLDHYYKDLSGLPVHERAATNFDCPKAVDSHLVIDQVRRLKQGYSIERPTYDFAQHVRTSDTCLVEANTFAIIEGLFALYWHVLTELLNTRVFITVGHDVCLERRIFRDVHERGRTEESVRLQYSTTVQPMCDLYVQPSLKLADVVLSGTAPVKQSIYTILNHIAATAADTTHRENARAGLSTEVEDLAAMRVHDHWERLWVIKIPLANKINGFQDVAESTRPNISTSPRVVTAKIRFMIGLYG
jgi:uridine kinase